MKAVSIRNIPDEIYAGLQAMAKLNRRSLQEQIKLILEQEVALATPSFLARSAQWRRKLQGRKSSDIVALLRKDRER